MIPTLEANRLLALALAALQDCKHAAECGQFPPSARLELVRDFATPAIVAIVDAQAVSGLTPSRPRGIKWKEAK